MIKIDLHTHSLKTGSDLQIANVFAQDLPLQANVGWYSSGIHPWHIADVDIDESLRKIAVASTDKQMVAIGECGLDKLSVCEMKIQEAVFRKHAELAEIYRKPLIIHCVRATNELIRIKKEFQPVVPWILHGFNGNRETTLELIRHGFYVSCGGAFLRNQQKIESAKNIPIDRLFLETDDTCESIDEIYRLSALLFEMDVNSLSKNIINNFKTVFRDVEMVGTN